MDTDFWRRVLSKRPWLCTYRHRAEFQKVSVFRNTSVRTSDLAFPKSVFQLITGLIPCSRQGTCSFGCWICNGNVALLSALVCTLPVVCNHTRWNRRDKQQSRVAVVTGPLCVHPFWMAMCHYKFPATFHWMMRAVLISSCHISYQMTADTHRGPSWRRTAVS
jgi:hypothetical protein